MMNPHTELVAAATAARAALDDAASRGFPAGNKDELTAVWRAAETRLDEAVKATEAVTTLTTEAVTTLTTEAVAYLDSLDPAPFVLPDPCSLEEA